MLINLGAQLYKVYIRQPNNTMQLSDHSLTSTAPFGNSIPDSELLGGACSRRLLENHWKIYLHRNTNEFKWFGKFVNINRDNKFLKMSYPRLFSRVSLLQCCFSLCSIWWETKDEYIDGAGMEILLHILSTQARMMLTWEGSDQAKIRFNSFNIFDWHTRNIIY